MTINIDDKTKDLGNIPFLLLTTILTNVQKIPLYSDKIIKSITINKKDIVLYFEPDGWVKINIKEHKHE